MFRGVIKNNSRKIIINYIKSVKNPRIAVGCSGAFTIETILVNNYDVKEILSSDVSIFSNALGFFLMDKDYVCSFVHKDYMFLNEIASKGLDYKTASLLYLQDVSDFYRSDNYYNKRMVKSYLLDAQNILEKKVERLNLVKDQYTESGVKFKYLAKDIIDFVKDVPKDYLFVAFPPFYFGDYEKQYKFLRETIVSKDLECEYRMFDDASLIKMEEDLQSRGVNYLIGTNKVKLFEDKNHINVVSYDYFSPNEIVCFITNRDLEHLVVNTPNKVLDSYNVEFVTKKDVDNLSHKTDLQIKEIPGDLLDTVRRSRISEKVKKFSMPMSKFGVFADNKLVGVFGIDSINMRYESDTFYLLSYLPVKNHRRVAKLVAALATSKEVKTYLRNKYLVDYDHILTTCFTQSPVSMKYRNFWKVDKREQDKSTGMKYINYISEMGKYNIRQIFDKWLGLSTTTIAKKK